MRLLFILVLLPLAALAQPEPERLPDLTPRAFEIRGDLQISLPNLERQPLRGFAPPPRTYVVPANRRTFVAPYRQDLDGLPTDPLADPPPPEVATLNPLTGRIDAGFGRYSSRLGRLTISRGGFGVNASYSGFMVGDGTVGTDESDVFDGRLSYTSRGETRFGFDLGGTYDGYLSTSGDHAIFSEPQWSNQTIDGGISIVSSTSSRAPFELEARFGSTTIALDVEDVLSGTVRSSSDFPEARLEGQGDLQINRFHLDADGAISGLGDEGLGESLTSYSAGGTLRLDVGRGQLDIGARLLGYDASTANGGGSSTNVGPVVHFKTPLSPTTRLFLRTDPQVERRGLATLYRENPYTAAEPFVTPDLHLIDGEGGLEIQSRSIRFTAYGGLRLSPVALYFERETDGANFTGLYTARYGEARVLRGGGSVTLYAPSGLRLTAGAEFRSGTLTSGDDGDRDIPYFSPLTGHLSLAVPFASGRGLVQATGSAESSRPTETEDVDADGWATLDAEAHYWFTSSIGLLVRAERLAGRAERWPGFPRPPSALLAGLRVRW